jgi:hypothetical protein
VRDISSRKGVQVPPLTPFIYKNIGVYPEDIEIAVSFNISTS